MSDLEVRDPANMDPEEIIARGVFPTQMKFFTVMIDGPMARDLLLFNVAPRKGEKGTNRKPSPIKIKEYKAKMRGGEWYLNPQPLIFTEANGQGVIEQGDGQQRLMALVELSVEMPDIAMPFVVCVNAPLLAKMVVDQGKPRLLADWLRMAGEPNATQLGYAVKQLYAIKELQPFTTIPTWRNIKISPTVQQEFLEKHPGLRQAVKEGLRIKTLVIPHVGAVLWYLMREKYDVFVASQFLDGLEKGANLDVNDPRLRVREFLARRKMERYPWDGLEQLGVLITAVNAWLIGSERYRAGGSFTLLSKKFPELLDKDQIPEALFARE